MILIPDILPLRKKGDKHLDLLEVLKEVVVPTIIHYYNSREFNLSQWKEICQRRGDT